LEPSLGDEKEHEFTNLPVAGAARNAETVEQSGTTGGSNY